jgi:archaetidylinositol phosphate synthase
MALQALKFSVQERMFPLARRVPLSPNALTALGLAAMGAAGILLARRRLGEAGALVLASGFLDLLDGAVARAQHRETRFGALLDRVADRVSDVAALAGTAAGGYAGSALVLFAAGAVLIASYVSACLEAMTGSRIGEALSLRGVRVTILALACFSGRVREGVALIALLGVWAVAARLREAHRLLARGD